MMGCRDAAFIFMKEKLLHCSNCNEITRTLVIHRYASAGKRAGKLTRKVEHCTECNKRKITKGQTNSKTARRSKI